MPRSTQEIIEALRGGVIHFDTDQVASAARELVTEGGPVIKAIMEGLALGLVEVGYLYEEHEYFVPEVYMCAETLAEGLNILSPQVIGPIPPGPGLLLLGPNRIEPEDLGRDLLRQVFSILGFEIRELTLDETPDQVLAAGLTPGTKVVAVAPMLLPGGYDLAGLVRAVRARDSSIKIMVGPTLVAAEDQLSMDGNPGTPPPTKAILEATNMIGFLRDLYEETRPAGS